MQFGRLTVISKNGNKHLVKCSCGIEKLVLTSNLTKGKTKSCGCLRNEISTKRILQYPGEKFDKGIGSCNFLWNRYKQSAKKRHIEFLLNKEEFKTLTSKKCTYCNSEPSQYIKGHRSNGGYIYNGIDRVNPSIGYVLKNCVTCCDKCNYMKRLMTVEDFLSHVNKIFQFNSEQE